MWNPRGLTVHRTITQDCSPSGGVRVVMFGGARRLTRRLRTFGTWVACVTPEPPVGSTLSTCWCRLPSRQLPPYPTPRPPLHPSRKCPEPRGTQNSPSWDVVGGASVVSPVIVPGSDRLPRAGAKSGSRRDRTRAKAGEEPEDVFVCLLRRGSRPGRPLPASARPIDCRFLARPRARPRAVSAVPSGE